jgi:hypothetical protein
MQRPLYDGDPQPRQKRLKLSFEIRSILGTYTSPGFLPSCGGRCITEIEILLLTLSRAETSAAAAAAAVEPRLRTPTVTPTISTKPVMAAIQMACGMFRVALPVSDCAFQLSAEPSVGDPLSVAVLGGGALATARCSASWGCWSSSRSSMVVRLQSTCVIKKHKR